MNTGEINEIKVKLKLIELRDKNLPLQILNSTRIKSVSFDHNEFKRIPPMIKLEDLSNEQCINLANELGVFKAGTREKADVYINNIPYSIKSMEKCPPALVNHTARPGWENVCKEIGCDINTLDEIVDKYWKLRLTGKITEDIANSNSNSPFFNYKEYMTPLLNYFLFKGSGSGVSKHPADYILDFVHPFQTETWMIHGQEYIKEHWDRLVFSLRSKKGMGNYPEIEDKIKKESMAKWTRFYNDSYKGALHVRVK